MATDRKVITQSFELERRFVEPVVAAVLHTILFHRCFGNVSPRENRILHSVTYASVDSPDICAAVDGKVAEMIQSLSPTQGSRGQISLLFTETKPRRAWFSKAEEEICWEEWVLNIQSAVCTAERELGPLLSSAEEQAKSAIFTVIQAMDKNKDHIPLISSSQRSPFPFHISVAPATGLWSSMLKRAIRPGT